MNIETRVERLENDVTELKDSFQTLSSSVSVTLAPIKSCDCNEEEVRQMIAALQAQLTRIEQLLPSLSLQDKELKITLGVE